MATLSSPYPIAQPFCWCNVRGLFVPPGRGPRKRAHVPRNCARIVNCSSLIDSFYYLNVRLTLHFKSAAAQDIKACIHPLFACTLYNVVISRLRPGFAYSFCGQLAAHDMTLLMSTGPSFPMITPCSYSLSSFFQEAQSTLSSVTVGDSVSENRWHN